MILHEAIGVNDRPVGLVDTTEVAKEAVSILVTDKDIFALDAALDDMVESVRIFYTKWA
jgi:hypothetical protein